PARQCGSQDEDPVRALPRRRRGHRPLRGTGPARRVPGTAAVKASMDQDQQPLLRLVGVVDDAAETAQDAPEAAFSLREPSQAEKLATTHHLPFVDLVGVGVDAGAAKSIALPVLNRAVAIPFGVDNGVLKVAITDPQDVRALDELRLATSRTVEFHVASEDDVLAELRRLSRAAEAMNAALIEEITIGEGEEEGDDL